MFNVYTFTAMTVIGYRHWIFMFCNLFNVLSITSNYKINILIHIFVHSTINSIPYIFSFNKIIQTVNEKSDKKCLKKSRYDECVNLYTQFNISKINKIKYNA